MYRLEIKAILDELRDKKAKAREIEKILKSDARLWTIVRKEIAAARESFADARRSKIGGRGARETEYSEDDLHQGAAAGSRSLDEVASSDGQSLGAGLEHHP